MKKQVIVSFSGGRTSAFMTWWLMRHCKDQFDMKVVFANTGKEREETLAFVEECSQHFGWEIVWIEAITNPTWGIGVRPRIVDFQSASRKGEPFEAMIQKLGIPNITAPRCTRELKASVIRAYAHSLGWRGYHTAVGIRADEPRRLNWERAKKERLLFPLASMCRVTKNDINSFWAAQPFDLRLASYEGNCDLCWKKSIRKLLTITKEHPELTGWWKDMEQRYENLVPVKLKENKNIKYPLRFFRDNMSIDDIIAASKEPFIPAVNESGKPADISPLYDEELDEQHFQCAESCEAF